MRQTVIIFGVACVGTLFVVLAQRHQLGELRGEQARLLTQSSAASENPVSTSPPAANESAAPARSPSLELLQLRNEVHRLTERQRELAAVRPENERLRAQVATSRTNGAAPTTLPPGYIRKSEARFAGYNSPEATLQSFLWAVQNRDFTNVALAFTAETAGQMQRQVASGGAEEFFKDAVIIPGMHIVSQQQTTNGLIEAEVEIIPGQSMPEKMRFRQVNGEWKLDD